MDIFLPLAKNMLIMDTHIRPLDTREAPSDALGPRRRRSSPCLSSMSSPATPHTPVTPVTPGTPGDVFYPTLPSPAAADMDYSHWTEYAARRSVVKFRTRQRTKRLNSRNGTSLRRPPSHLVQHVLHEQYDLSRVEEPPGVATRTLALFYCWYFGWITDVYNFLSEGGAVRSLVTWTIACVLVTLATMCVFLGVVGLLHLVVKMCTVLLHATVNFTALMFLVFLLTIMTIAIFNFG